jgi:hypothetical protein
LHLPFLFTVFVACVRCPSMAMCSLFIDALRDAKEMKTKAIFFQRDTFFSTHKSISSFFSPPPD